MKLVFVHFGQPPSHLSANILDVCNRFPHIDVVLISDFSVDGMESHQNFSQKYFVFGGVINLLSIDDLMMFYDKSICFCIDKSDSLFSPQVNRSFCF